MYELAVVIPTLNERDNIMPLIERLEQALTGVAWEVIFVDDDSRDGTADLVRSISRTRPNIRVLHRVGRNGLSSACTEGMLASHAPFVAVMDADLQHDASLLPHMLAALKAETELDIVVGSRYVPGGGLGEFSPARRFLSRGGALISRLALKVPLQDPMSGFFMLRTEFFHETMRNMSNKGFKILLDLFLSSTRPVRFRELPYLFGKRVNGDSKLDGVVSLEYLYLMADKLFGHILPIRFVIFVGVGALGMLVHLTILSLFHRRLGYAFDSAQMIATLTAMTGNFYLNNRITYRDQRLQGWGFARGLASFYVACAIGALANFQVADLLFNTGVPWALAGILGAVVGSVWNYGVTSTFTWRTRPSRGATFPTVPARRARTA